MKKHKRTLFSYLMLFLLILYIPLSFAAPIKSLWDIWQPYNANSTKVINHQLYQNFLTKYVSTNAQGLNLVHYSAVTPQDKAELERYLSQMSVVSIAEYNRNEQLAYWINVYNALTIETILNHYPVQSIRDIKLGGFFSDGPWDAKLLTIDHIPVSLNDMEHRIIRPIWNDPRTHYALNCASYSCPNLQKTAYTGASVNRMLTSDAKAYINSPRGVDIKNNQLIISSIYDWYQIDFGSNDQAVITHLEQYADPALAKQLKSFNMIAGYQYNWQLNGN